MTTLTKQDEPEFTVFYEHGQSFSSAVFDAADIQDALEHFVLSYDYRPVAWSTERSISHGGARFTSDIRIESIAAGRVIDFIDGKYVPRGVSVEGESCFTPDAFDKAHATVISTITPTPDKLANTAEPKRAPLDWAKRVSFDNFEGFRVNSFHNWMVGEERAANQGPMQLMSDSSNPLHGSAYLQRKAG